MRAAKDLLSFAGAVGDTINFNAYNFRILGSSIPTLMEKGKGYKHVSITLPAEKHEALIFFVSSNDNEEAFLEFCRKESGRAWAYLDEEFIPPCEMAVNGDTITIKTSEGKIVSTDEKPGAYKVDHDTMCRFLIEDITEEELLAEAVKLAEEQSELEQLRQKVIDRENFEQRLIKDKVGLKKQLERSEKEIETRQSSEANWIKKFLEKEEQLKDKEDVLKYVFRTAHDSWSPFRSRISLIRKKLLSVPGLCEWNPKK